MAAAATRLGSMACIICIVIAAAAAAQDRPPREPTPAEITHVFNPVEGRIAVLACKPEGTLVERGELVCELDPASLKDRLAVEEIRLRSVQADLDGANLALEAAELALAEFTDGTFKQELQSLVGDRSKKEAARMRAEERLEWSDLMVKKGYVSLARNVADKIDLQSATFAAEQATTAQQVFTQFTKDRKLKLLQADVEVARSSALEKEAIRDRQKGVRASLARQVEQCRVTAPATGIVRYGRPFGPGAVLRDGELVLQIVPETTPAPAAK